MIYTTFAVVLLIITNLLYYVRDSETLEIRVYTQKSAPSLFENLWKNRKKITTSLIQDISGAYNSKQIQYPFSKENPFPEKGNPSNASIDSSLRIKTHERRSVRIPLLIKSIKHDIFKDDVDPDRAWKVVLGIPSTDTTSGARRRYIQRGTFFWYSSVWNGKKHQNAKMVVKYLLAFHPSQDYNISKRLQREGLSHKDIVFFNIKEGVPAKKGERLYEGKPISVLSGMSQKTYAWFSYAVDRFKTDYILKGDDDAFYRCNLLVNELESYRLPRVYYGRGSNYMGIFRTSGILIGLSYDLADWVRDSLIAENFTSFAFEDVAVGIWFSVGGVPFTPISDCRLHDAHGHFSIEQPVRNNSLAIHHIPTDPLVYWELFLRFRDNDFPPLRVTTVLPKGVVHWIERLQCPRENDTFAKTGKFSEWPDIPHL